VLRKSYGFVFILFLLTVLPAHAGMTVITLTDIAEARLQSISFFAAVYLLLAWGVMALWNYLAKAFPWMPKINYRRAVALMLVSGLFLYVILTMISGARELMTPGAWKKQGIGYELSGELELPSKELRKESLTRLKKKLWEHAQVNEGNLPVSIFDESLSIDDWALPNVPGYYAYLSGRKIGGGTSVLVYEPSVMGAKRFVLLTDGSIEAWSATKLRKELDNE